MQKIKATNPAALSADLKAENIAQLRALFPELLTESANGVALNVNVLKQLVGDATITDTEEKYGLNWHGKRRARQLALTPSIGTLRPCPKESVDWDTTQNLMIEGDNLEVLKLLQKSYAGKVKLIYIDPPYNTGKDFVYPDNFQDNIKNYLELTGQVEGGRKISSNTEASGRFHTDWLNMMYPRLRLARNLLRENGVIFISIDDVEAANLRKVCDEIFGEENFIANVVWQKKYAPQNDATYFSDMHDHILVYAKLAKRTKNDEKGWNLDLLPRTGSQNDAYKNLDNDPRGIWKAGDLSVKTYSAKNDYAITTPGGRVVHPPESRCWVVSPERYAELVADNRIWFGTEGNNVPSLKRFLSEVQDGAVPVTWWTYQDCGHNQDAKKELKDLFADAEIDTIFDTPKPVKLITRMLQLATKSDPNALVMDFFAGSGTTGQAVYEMNLTDEGRRRCILVQLPEPIEGDAQTIAELTKERLRRAAKKIKEETPMFAGDTGFRVFKLDTSNIRAWNPDRDNLEKTLLDHEEHILPGRTEADIVYELLLKLGLDLCVPIETRAITTEHTESTENIKSAAINSVCSVSSVVKKEVHAIGGGVLLACLSERIAAIEVEALAQGIVAWRKELAPAGDTTCVFRDSAFENDIAKSNLAAILEQYGIANVRSL
ncbi:MAG: DNA methyltransferase [Nitrosomonas sp.]|nr:DNA methyltransferase [Nitrosomonas sp.]MDP1950311.1 DNA methyltransferase [Nitrosomonas sp.]